MVIIDNDNDIYQLINAAAVHPQRTAMQVCDDAGRTGDFLGGGGGGALLSTVVRSCLFLLQSGAYRRNPRRRSEANRVPFDTLARRTLHARARASPRRRRRRRTPGRCLYNIISCIIVIILFDYDPPSGSCKR